MADLDKAQQIYDSMSAEQKAQFQKQYGGEQKLKIFCNHSKIEHQFNLKAPQEHSQHRQRKLKYSHNKQSVLLLSSEDQNCSQNLTIKMILIKGRTKS